MTATRAARQRLRLLFSLHPGWLTLLAALGLTAVGIAAIGTADAGHSPSTGFARRQTMWLGLSLVVMLIFTLPRPRIVGMLAYPVFGLLVVVLAVMTLPFMPRSIVPVLNGTRAWINLGFMNFQPSEVTKIAFVVAVAWYLRHRENYRNLKGLLVPLGITLLPVAVILKQPDMGTAMLFAPALFAVLVAAGAKLRHMSALLAIATLFVAVNVAAIYLLPDSMQLLAPHQRQRIIAMVSLTRGEDRLIDGSAYQQYVARNVSGAGRVTGYGHDRAATVVGFNRLPEDHNDMIFAVILARWGWVGGVVVLGLYGLLLMSMLTAAALTRDPFARLSIVGFTGILAAQTFINIGMTIGLPGVPIIGITLPFVSYGGSSLLATFAMIGLVVNFSSAKPMFLARPSFEFDGHDLTRSRPFGPTL